jgi:hypothetical protein
MNRVDYDPVLVEQAVRLAVRSDRSAEQSLHKVVDPLYAIDDREARDRAFTRTFAEWFTQLGLGRPLAELIAERPLIDRRVARCLVRMAPRRKAESAELFVRRDSPTDPIVRTLVIQLCAESLVEPESVRPFLRRELLHVGDMLDDDFGYVREEFDGLPAQQNLVRDRYGVLWDIYVERRLLDENLVGGERMERLRVGFEKAFTLGGQPPAGDAFDRAMQCRSLTHRQLYSWANEPRRVLEVNGADSPQPVVGRSGPGQSCPICGFPTFDWLDLSAEGGTEAIRAIQRICPTWTPADGVCRRCAEACACCSHGPVVCDGRNDERSVGDSALPSASL